MKNSKITTPKNRKNENLCNLSSQKKRKRKWNDKHMESSCGNLLRQGIKFTSQKQYSLAFQQLLKDKKNYFLLDSTKNSHSHISTKSLKNETHKSLSKIQSVKEQVLKDSVSKIPFNLLKLKKVLAHNSSPLKQIEVKQVTEKDDLNVSMMEKLDASRFRFINEKLYTQTGKASMKMFAQDQGSFEAYHKFYKRQEKKWPLNPLNLIITSILKLSDDLVIADFGCGEARLARSVPNKVYSFDLCVLNDMVTACDMAHTDLKSGSVDVAVFCLSLMGTNLKDYLLESNRVLKQGGFLKIAEVSSRFQELTLVKFIKLMEKFGFKLKWKNEKMDYFYLLDFVKEKTIHSKLPEINLKPCLYKKR